MHLNELETPEVLPKAFDFSRFRLDDFETFTAHQFLYDNYHGSGKMYLLAVEEMSKVAKAVGFNGFKGTMAKYAQIEETAALMDAPQKETDFPGQPLPLNCGQWDCNRHGVFRIGRIGRREMACSHPIMPVERLQNVDTGETRIKLAFSREREQWRTIIVDPSSIASPRKIVDTLSNYDISVTSSTATALVDYLSEVADLNRNIIPARKSVSHLGYVPGEGFAPFADNLTIDAGAQFAPLLNTVSSGGLYTQWLDVAMECRKMSVTARVMLAASFAAPLVSVVGSLPFFVHLWGEASGTGKTVALMLAASVWGDPDVGRYCQTFNATRVGHEMTAAFLNQLPLCIDELQLTKDSKGKSSFDVYQLAQGVGRIRGTRTGGIQNAPTWKTCFLSTGESPIAGDSAGSGAMNRVIDIECASGHPVIIDGPRVSATLKQHYGHAGEVFVQKLYESDNTLKQAREVYREYFAELSTGNSTEKQAMAAAVILTADLCATAWIFKDDMELTPDDLKVFLASRESVSAGRRAYDWACNWVAANRNRFFREGDELPAGDIYGKVDGDVAYINRGVLNSALVNAGFSEKPVLSYWKSNALLDMPKGRNGFTRSVSIRGVKAEHVPLVLGLPSWVSEAENIELLPL